MRKIIYLLVLILGLISTACGSRNSGATEESVLDNFHEFYLYAADKKQLKNRSLQHLQRMQKQNSDAYRTIAYTWNNESIKECAIKQTDSENNVILSDFDKFVQKEKTNFHIQEIDEAIKPCIRNYYVNNWERISRMLNFNIQVVNKQL